MKGLCFRCEHRARFHEVGSKPRYECGQIDEAVCGCYMYKPVIPLIIKPRDNDDRPLTLNIFSARMEAVSYIDPSSLALNMKPLKDNRYVAYWEIKNIE